MFTLTYISYRAKGHIWRMFVIVHLKELEKGKYTCYFFSTSLT